MYNTVCVYIYIYMGMDQYLLIPFLGGWTSIYQLFWGSPGVQGFDPSPYIYIYIYIVPDIHLEDIIFPNFQISHLEMLV